MRTRLFLTLFLLVGCLPVNGQITYTGVAEMIDSFGAVPDDDFLGRSDLFLASLRNKPDAKAVIYIHGTPAQIAARERRFQNFISSRQFDPLRIAFVKGRNVGNVRSDLWIVPAGAAPPEIKPEAWIFRELGPATKVSVTKAMSDVDKEMRKLNDHQLYIINYGTPAQIAQRERWIRDGIVFRRFDTYRITLVNGGRSGLRRTVMWLVPPGAENPKP